MYHKETALSILFHQFFDFAKNQKESGCNNAEDYDGQDDTVEPEDLAAVYDEVSKTGLCSKEFTDDHPDE